MFRPSDPFHCFEENIFSLIIHLSWPINIFGRAPTGWHTDRFPPNNLFSSNNTYLSRMTIYVVLSHQSTVFMWILACPWTCHELISICIPFWFQQLHIIDGYLDPMMWVNLTVKVSFYEFFLSSNILRILMLIIEVYFFCTSKLNPKFFNHR